MIHSHACPPKPTPCPWCARRVPLMKGAVKAAPTPVPPPVVPPPVVAVPPAPVKARGLCAHLGADTGERRVCGPCGGRVELKVLACAVHSRCTVAKAVAGVACCSTCPDYLAAEGV
jgi:hypothetical protein